MVCNINSIPVHGRTVNDFVLSILWHWPTIAPFKPSFLKREGCLGERPLVHRHKHLRCPGRYWFVMTMVKKGTQALQRITSGAICWIQHYKGGSIKNLVCCGMLGMLSWVCSVELQSRCSTPGRPCLCSACPVLVIWALTGFSYKKTTPFITSNTRQRGCSHESLLLHSEIKARPHRCVITGAEWELPVGSPIIITRLSLPCTEGEMQHNTGLK